ncbi:MAG: carbon-nitrogen hydrolase family protein [Chloroflexi bacterium]|nr:carbon-nitrogen hydrolase family protein [Chloroflexota bacterium]
MPDPYTAAAVQWAPAYGDLRAGVGRAIEAIDEAAREGASLIVLPEAWLPGYPYWCTEQRPSRAVSALYRELVENGVEVPGPVTDALGEAAERANATVVIGVTERAGGTLYNTLCYIDPDGDLLGAHRKLVPTLSERTVWGMGDGSDLDAYDTPAGRVGGLICYEHFMAPARYALAGLGVEVHASVWPGYPFLHANVDAATRMLAVENACAVVVAREVMSADRLPAGTPFAEHPRMWEMNGGSAIIAPGGKYLAEPVYDDETILYAEIDPADLVEAKRWVDGVGHYSRPDVFRLHWDRSPKPPIATE